jgi:hypothetical protein
LRNLREVGIKRVNIFGDHKLCVHTTLMGQKELGQLFGIWISLSFVIFYVRTGAEGKT